MENVTNSIIEAVQYMNQTGFNIPLTVQTVTSTNSTQFWLTFLIAAISSFFILWYIYTAFVVQMIASITIHAKLYRMKKMTGRPILFIKHTMSDLFNSSMINQKTMMDLNKAISKFEGKPFDLVLHTPGGEIFSSLFLSRILKNYGSNIRVFIPYYAMSGGTLLALSGNEIYMGNNACLGPVDPQLGSLFKYGSAKSWDRVLKIKGKRADDDSINFSFMGQQYTKTIYSYILKLLADKMDAKSRNRFARILTSGDIEHAYPFTGQELHALGLPVKKLPKEITAILNKVILSKLYEGVNYKK